MSNKSEKASTAKLKEIAGDAKPKKKVAEAAAKGAAERITKEKILKYNYPEDVDNLEKRKKYRTQMRAKQKAFQKRLKVATKGKSDENPEEVQKEYDAFMKKHFSGLK